MLVFLQSFFIYLIAFAIGSLVALLVARQLYPATSEAEALEALEAKLAEKGATR